jgi:UDP-GlcNAc:undecaprenyl-phosphate GlcNAc-1-phosphate transferase
VSTSLWSVLPAVAAAALAFAFAPLTARLAARVGAIDRPGQRKTHSQPIPRLGGLAVLGAVAIVWASAEWLSARSLPRELSLGLLAGGFPILAISALDDVKGVPARWKFLVHLIAAMVAVASGVSLGEVVHLFDAEISLGAWAAPLSVVWLVGVTNAFNLIDGLDGLSAGLALIAAVCMAAVFGLAGQPVMAAAALVLAGALAGFLPYNLHPARLFLGDVGATALGFCLGAFALEGGSTLSSGFAALVPAFVMGLPIADTVITLARRTISRLESHDGGPFVADRNHIHHRLLAHGIGHERAVLILYGTGCVCAGAGFVSLLLQARHAALFILAVLVAGAIGVHRLAYDEFAFLRRGAALRVYESPVVKTSMFVVFADLAMSAMAAYVALGLKLDRWSPGALLGPLIDLVALLAPVTALIYWYTGIYRGSWRVADVADLGRACGAALGVTVVGAVVHPLLAPVALPRSFFVIYGLVLVVLMTSSRASYVVLRASQRRGSHPGIPVLVYDAGRHGIAAAQDLFANAGAGLKPIGFVDDDVSRRGRLVRGLPVLGRSYELDSLVATHAPAGIVLASPLVSPDCEERLATACTRRGIGLYRMQLRLERLLESADATRLAAATSAQRAAHGGVSMTAGFVSAPAPQAEPCARCGGRNVHRSRARGIYERFRTTRRPSRPYRCNDCGWRGWLLPIEHATPFDVIGETDLRALDAAFSTPVPGRDSLRTSSRS